MKGTFQYILLGIFGLFIIVGVFVFASLNKFSGGGSGATEAKAVVWGTVDEGAVSSVVRSLSDAGTKLNVTYKQFPESAFRQSLIEALARGAGPDVILFPHDLLVQFQDLITPIPFTSLSERLFKDTYIEEAELYRTPAGFLAVPVFIDPMVMYWNRTLFTNAGIARPPQYWEELAGLVPALSHVDESHTVTQSAIALGEFANIAHAKDIMSLLMLQGGTPIVIRDAQSSALSAALNGQFGLAEVPAVSAVRFFTEFSNPVKALYSWNRALPASQEYFLAGKLAMYLGFASEAPLLQEKNPNLDFDAAQVPQIKGGAATTFGRMYGLALLKGSTQPQAAFAAILSLASAPAAATWNGATGLPPARRESLATPPGDAYGALSYAAALRAAGWPDPDPGTTPALFESAVADVTSGRLDVNRAIDNAQASLEALIGATNAQ